jgi:predicted DNA-binding transcriptional regulator YafY
MVPVLCGSGTLAFLRLGASEIPAGLMPPPENGDWDWWRNLDRTPLTSSDDLFASAMIRAAAARRDLWIVYQDGSHPGETRKISPLGVFTVEGYQGIYVEAFCHNRESRRTFRIGRITSAV